MSSRRHKNVKRIKRAVKDAAKMVGYFTKEVGKEILRQRGSRGRILIVPPAPDCNRSSMEQSRSKQPKGKISKARLSRSNHQDRSFLAFESGIRGQRAAISYTHLGSLRSGGATTYAHRPKVTSKAYLTTWTRGFFAASLLTACDNLSAPP